jgi:hypothetical protein
MAGTLTVQNLQGPTSGANANKIIIPSGQTLDASGGTLVPSAGGVIQVVHGRFTTFTTITSTSPVATGITATITPTSTSSKILILASTNGIYKGSGGTFMRTQIYRNSNVAFHVQEIATYDNGSGANSGNVMSHHLDSPNSTSALTYEIYAALSNSGTVYFNNQNNGRPMESGITLMEIAG